MLDQKGIKLDEVSLRYPRTFQPLGYDAVLDVDEFTKPKVISTFQMCVNAILTLLFMKPGQYPSIPELGIDIEKYLHEYADDPNVPNEILNKLYDQCNRLQLVVPLTIDVYIEKAQDGSNALIVKIEGTDTLTYGYNSHAVIIGITYDKLNRLYTRKAYI